MLRGTLKEALEVPKVPAFEQVSNEMSWREHAEQNSGKSMSSRGSRTGNKFTCSKKLPAAG